MELVSALSSGLGDPNGNARKLGQGKKSPKPPRSRYRQSLKPQLENALQVLQPLRDEYPSNPSFAIAEIRIRQRLATVNKRRGRLEDAKRQLEMAIKLQTTLVETMPDSVSHRCWRALLNCSLAEVLRGLRQPAVAAAAIDSARQDLAVIPDEHSEHPLVQRVEKMLLVRTPSSR